MAGSIDKNLRKAKVLVKNNALSEAAELYTEILKKISKKFKSKAGPSRIEVRDLINRQKKRSTSRIRKRSSKSF
jgi:hypothetical protein